MSCLDAILLFWVLPSLCIALPVAYVTMVVDGVTFENVWCGSVIWSIVLWPIGLVGTFFMLLLIIGRSLTLDSKRVKKLLFKKVLLK